MPWGTLKLDNGALIPEIAYGTWRRGNGQETIDLIDIALGTGFSHIDTAQAYQNEEELGVALKESGLEREDLYITTKFSGRTDVDTAIADSLKYLGVPYVDLYLIHNPRLALPNPSTLWKKMEVIYAKGYAKSIGVSNFDIVSLSAILAIAHTKPVVNQILFNPYVLDTQGLVIEYGKKHGIVSEAYSPLIPLIHLPNGTVATRVKAIAARLDVEPEQVLLAWTRSKGVVVVTSSTNEDRLERYMEAGDLDLAKADIAAIDASGRAGAGEWKGVPK